MSEREKQKTDWKVTLEVFEGPLDLLLHLINQLEIDIYDIPIAEITEQYLKYIHSMNVLELDTAGEYLVMAATLMSIKSQLLVPRNEDFDSVDVELTPDEDPREHLIELLLEYRKFKNAAGKLQELEEKRSIYATKEPSDVSDYQKNVPLRKNEISLEQLTRAFDKVWQDYAVKKPQRRVIEAEEISVSEKIGQITSHLKQKTSMTFTELVCVSTKKELVTTFLAVLELVKNNQLKAVQKEIHGEIYLDYIGH